METIAVSSKKNTPLKEKKTKPLDDEFVSLAAYDNEVAAAAEEDKPIFQRDTLKKKQQQSKKQNKKKQPKANKGDEDVAVDQEMLEKQAKYLRGEKEQKKNILKGVKSERLRNVVKKNDQRRKEAAMLAAKAEILLTAEAGYLETEADEDSWRVSQKVLRDAVDIQTARKMFDLHLEDFGAYSLDYTKNGTFLLLGGEKGHVAMIDWQKKKLMTEIKPDETVRDVKFLHNESMFAVAQKKYVYIYDKRGTELHCLRHHIDVNKIEFLPYHFLMVTAANTGHLKYHDVSTGEVVASYATKSGPLHTMRPNPRNAIMTLGHYNGTVTMWTPNLGAPVVKMLCHKGPVRSLAYEPAGNILVTTGADSCIHVWDIRTYKKLHSYFSIPPATTIDISQRGLLAVGSGNTVEIWKDALHTKVQKPYMKHTLSLASSSMESIGNVYKDIMFVPFDDVLGLGHNTGFSSIVVPGAGEPNLDTFEANPFQNKKQRQEAEVKALLEKIPADMITLDPDMVGSVDRASSAVKAKEKKEEEDFSKLSGRQKDEKIKKMRRKHGKMQKNIWDEKRAKLASEVEKRQREKEERKRQQQIAAGGEAAPAVLQRFKKRRVD